MEKFTKKDWLYVGGSVASLAALALWAYSQKQFSIGPAATTDVQNETGPNPGPMYTNYNTGAYGAPAYGADVSPDVSNTSCCCPNNDCAGTSPLANGQTFDDFQSLLQFYTQTNPNYIAGQIAATQQYYADFASGSAYQKNGQNLVASGIF